MDCHDVRSLLAFTRSGSDQIDATERAAVQQHLDNCLDCTAASQSEQLLDAALSAAMRNVPVPTDGKARLLAKLDASRPRPWLPIAAAAAVLLALALGATAWLMRPLPVFDERFATDLINGKHTDPDKVEEWFKEQGVEMATWRQLDHSLLWTYDVVEIRGQRVPKLIFVRRDRPAVAEVIVLRKDRFETKDLYGIPNNFSNHVIVERSVNEAYVYLVGSTEPTLNLFRLDNAN
jgi:hypothetical protein